MLNANRPPDIISNRFSVELLNYYDFDFTFGCPLG